MTYTTGWPSWFETTNQAPICENGPCEVCIQVGMVDEEINQAISSLRRLVAKRCDLRSEHNRLHGKFMHRLPIELNNHIFQLLLPRRTNWGRIRQSKDFVIPTYLASICRSWRDIAWSNPLLWSTIVIVPRGETADQFGTQFVRDWIVRSQTSPLTLCIVARKQEEELKGVIDVISQCSNRWHSLSLDMPLELLRALQHHTNLQYHQLKKFQIIVPNRSLGDDEIDQPVPLLIPTGLVEVAIHGVSLRSLPLSWTHLSVALLQAKFGLEDVVQLLQHAPRMTVCHIISLRAARLGNFSMPPITHKWLKTLGLYQICDSSVAAMLFGSLTLPNLQEFRTTNSLLLSPTYIPALVHRSSCPLTSVKFFGVFIPFSSLRPLPGVTDLVLHTTKDNFVKNLLHLNFFPDLRHLTLQLKTFLSLWDQGTISMLLARKRAGSNARQLRKLIVEQRDQADGPTLGDMWNSDVGKDLKAMNTRLTRYGFEVLCPNDDDKPDHVLEFIIFFFDFSIFHDSHKLRRVQLTLCTMKFPLGASLKRLYSH